MQVSPKPLQHSCDMTAHGTEQQPPTTPSPGAPQSDLGSSRHPWGAAPAHLRGRPQAAAPSLTSLFTGWGLFPSFTSRKWSGEIMAPMLRMSAYFSSSAVRAVPGSPVKGPSPGSAPAVSDGSGICPGIIAGDTAPRAAGRETRPVTSPLPTRHEPSRLHRPRESCCSPPGMAKARNEHKLGGRDQNIQILLGRPCYWPVDEEEEET